MIVDSCEFLAHGLGPAHKTGSKRRTSQSVRARHTAPDDIPVALVAECVQRSTHGFAASAAAACSPHSFWRGARLSKEISSGSAWTPAALRFFAESSLLARPCARAPTIHRVQ